MFTVYRKNSATHLNCNQWIELHMRAFTYTIPTDFGGAFVLMPYKLHTLTHSYLSIQCLADSCFVFVAHLVVCTCSPLSHTQSSVSFIMSSMIALQMNTVNVSIYQYIYSLNVPIDFYVVHNGNNPDQFVHVVHFFFSLLRSSFVLLGSHLKSNHFLSNERPIIQLMPMITYIGYE